MDFGKSERRDYISKRLVEHKIVLPEGKQLAMIEVINSYHPTNEEIETALSYASRRYQTGSVKNIVGFINCIMKKAENKKLREQGFYINHLSK